MSTSILPEDNKQLRACLLCSLIKNAHQFRLNGCENCESILLMKRKVQRVNDCTSNKFSGMVALMKPPQSWVARFQRIETFTPGLYAIQVFGRLPDDVEDELEARNIPYFPRDGSQVEHYGDLEEE